MDKQLTQGLVLNTPEFYQRQHSAAIASIGSNLLVAARYKNGTAIGHKYNRTQNNPRQWIEQVSDTSLMAGWGKWGHFQRICKFARANSSKTRRILGEDYITNFSLIGKLDFLFESASNASQPYHVSLLFIDLSEEKHTILHFDGSLIKRSQFAVLGGYEYQDLKQMKEESDIILAKHNIDPNRLPNQPHPKVIQELDDAYIRSIKAPLKSALVTLEEIYGDKDLLDTKEEAIEAVKNTLFEHDPPSKRETFEITTFENGDFESVYFTREKKERENPPPIPKPEFDIEVDFKKVEDDDEPV